MREPTVIEQGTMQGVQDERVMCQTEPTHSDVTQDETHRPKRISTDSGMGKSPPVSAVTSTTSLILKRDPQRDE